MDEPNSEQLPPTSASGPVLDWREHFQKKFKNFNGVPPHQREKKPNSSYPTLTDEEVTSTRAVIAYLLAREYVPLKLCFTTCCISGLPSITTGHWCGPGEYLTLNNLLKQSRCRRLK